MFTDSMLRGQEQMSNMIAVPQTGNVRDFTGIISKVPENDTPLLFGLPANIDRST
jgi:hypothetical protein